MSLRILIVEDDEDLRLALADLLAFEGYAVDTAEDGQAGIDLLRSGPRPELVLLDMRMPRKSGHDVLETIRSAPALSGLPVVVMTAETTNPPAGAVAWLHKPVLPSLLLAVVSNYLRTRPK